MKNKEYTYLKKKKEKWCLNGNVYKIAIHLKEINQAFRFKSQSFR